MYKVKRIQELRRSNAATAIPSKKKYSRKEKYKNKFDNQLKFCCARSGVSCQVKTPFTACDFNLPNTGEYNWIMSVQPVIIPISRKKKEVKMTTMIKTYCQSCGKRCSDISIYDAQFSDEPTCWECIFKSCPNCNGQGMTGWVSLDGDFDFEYCECNPLCLTLEEIK